MTPAPELAEAPPVTEANKTRFYVFRPDDDTMKKWTHVGTVEARDRDHALRVHFGPTPPLAVAVTENAWRPRRPKIESVVRGLKDAPMPEPNAEPGLGQPGEVIELDVPEAEADGDPTLAV